MDRELSRELGLVLNKGSYLIYKSPPPNR